MKAYYIRSSDNGISWSEPIAPADSFYEGSSQPDIAFSNGLLHLVWKGWLPNNPRPQIFHFSSSDGGITWGERHQVFYHGSAMLKYPRLAANGDTLFLSCRTNYRLLVFRSLDNGQTWGDSTAVEDSHSIVIDHSPYLLFSQGRLHLVYQLGIVGDPFGIEIYHRYSDDYGLTWSDRYPLSTLEPYPYHEHGQAPSAYVDSSGNIMALWFDYKYGSECGFTGDILGRVSTDNGDTWFPESRLTYTQTGSGSSCLILGGALYAVWMDDLPQGCFHPKIMYSESSDWGTTWRDPEVITGPAERSEFSPILLYNTVIDTTILHCVMRGDIPGHGSGLYYFKNERTTEISDMDNGIVPSAIILTAYPNPFNSSTVMSFSGSEGGDIKIEIFNLSGQIVKSVEAKGKEGKIVWDATDALGNKVSSGIYFARAKTSRNYSAIKLLYLK